MIEKYVEEINEIVCIISGGVMMKIYGTQCIGMFGLKGVVLVSGGIHP
jgi:hypothetical protein